MSWASFKGRSRSKSHLPICVQQYKECMILLVSQIVSIRNSGGTPTQPLSPNKQAICLCLWAQGLDSGGGDSSGQWGKGAFPPPLGKSLRAMFSSIKYILLRWKRSRQCTGFSPCGRRRDWRNWQHKSRFLKAGKIYRNDGALGRQNVCLDIWLTAGACANSV